MELQGEHAPNVKALTPQQLLDAAAKGRDEKLVDVPGLGPVLIGEISGTDRADILSTQVDQARANTIDVKGYQRRLLAGSVLDPTSPPEERRGAFSSMAEAASFMRLGGGKIRHLIDAIEEFSGMQAKPEAAVEAGKDDSSSTLSDSGTSG
jgi:hypothetical protein